MFFQASKHLVPRICLFMYSYSFQCYFSYLLLSFSFLYLYISVPPIWLKTFLFSYIYNLFLLLVFGTSQRFDIHCTLLTGFSLFFEFFRFGWISIREFIMLPIFSTSSLYYLFINMYGLSYSLHPTWNDPNWRLFGSSSSAIAVNWRFLTKYKS